MSPCRKKVVQIWVSSSTLIQLQYLSNVPEADGAARGAEGEGKRELDAGHRARVARHRAQRLLRRLQGCSSVDISNLRLEVGFKLRQGLTMRLGMHFPAAMVKVQFKAVLKMCIELRPCCPPPPLPPLCCRSTSCRPFCSSDEDDFRSLLLLFSSSLLAEFFLLSHPRVHNCGERRW